MPTDKEVLPTRLMEGCQVDSRYEAIYAAHDDAMIAARWLDGCVELLRESRLLDASANEVRLKEVVDSSFHETLVDDELPRRWNNYLNEFDGVVPDADEAHYGATVAELQARGFYEILFSYFEEAKLLAPYKDDQRAEVVQSLGLLVLEAIAYALEEGRFFSHLAGYFERFDV